MDTRTVEEEILLSHPEVDRQLARNICGAMMFEGNAALKKIAVLSGGEKSRVMLGKLLVTPLNLLLLDEPTNHLDMESCDAMLAAIDSFQGTVIMVTHNEMFLHALAERLIVFQNDGSYVFEGSYQEFLDTEGWKREGPISEPEAGGGDTEKVYFKLTKKEIRRKRSKFINERAKVLKPLEQSILKVENTIVKQEKRLDELTAAMQAASQDQDGDKIAALSQSIHSCRSVIDKLFDELEQSTGAFDQKKAVFDKKLEEIESAEGIK